MKKLIFLLGIVLMLSVVCVSAGTWTPHYFNDGGDYWSAVGSSNTGDLLIVMSDGGYAWTSRDYGVTWVEHADGLIPNWWTSVTTASTGKRIYATSYYSESYSDGFIYTSDDFGDTWAKLTGSGAKGWTSIDASENGAFVVATSDDIDQGVFYSGDYGVTWNKFSNLPEQVWSGVSVGAQGKYIVAVENYDYSIVGGDGGGFIFTSDDYGATWTKHEELGTKYWNEVSMSVNGKHIVAVPYKWNDGFIYTSDDYGATWTPYNSSGARRWLSVASSNDGGYVMAGMDNGVDNDQPYYSEDFGFSWTPATVIPSGYWNSVATTGTGNLFLIADYSYNGSVWTYCPSDCPVLSHGKNPHGIGGTVNTSRDSIVFVPQSALGTGASDTSGLAKFWNSVIDVIVFWK